MKYEKAREKAERLMKGILELISRYRRTEVVSLKLEKTGWNPYGEYGLVRIPFCIGRGAAKTAAEDLISDVTRGRSLGYTLSHLTDLFRAGGTIKEEGRLISCTMQRLRNKARRLVSELPELDNNIHDISNKIRELRDLSKYVYLGKDLEEIKIKVLIEMLEKKMEALENLLAGSGFETEKLRYLIIDEFIPGVRIYKEEAETMKCQEIFVKLERAYELKEEILEHLRKRVEILAKYQFPYAPEELNSKYLQDVYYERAGELEKIEYLEKELSKI